MQLSLLSVFVFLAVPLRVIACEGECIEGVTNKFCDLYEAPVKKTLDKIVKTLNHVLSLA
jgi:hypothetical protein